MTFSRRKHSAAPGAAVLVVDGDADGRAAIRAGLRRLDVDVFEADSGAAALALARAHHVDLVLIDSVLPDMSGLDLIVALRKERIRIPWLFTSGRMTTPLAVEAMRLGAVDAVDRPFDVERVVVAALRLSARDAARWPCVPPAARFQNPKSAAERWASLVLRGCAAEHDLKTIGDWASVAGISYSALTESCRLVGIRPHDARDFLRMLRALLHAGGRVEHLEHGLNVNDHRTLKALFDRAGLRGRAAGTIAFKAFIDRQQFVDPASEPVKVMLRMIGGVEDGRLEDAPGSPGPRQSRDSR